MRRSASTPQDSGFKHDRQHCDSCGAAVQLGKRSCPWCTTPYAVDAEPEPPIEQTWNEDEDPSHGEGYWVGNLMARPQVIVAVETSGALTPNEIREIGRQWETAHRGAASTFGLLPADLLKPRTDDPLGMAGQPVRDITRPQPPKSRLVVDAPWPLSTLFRAVKGLFK